MGGVEIITDSVAQVPEDIVKELGIHVVPLTIIVGEERFRDGIDLPSATLFRRMRTEEIIVQTTSPSMGDFYQVFEERFGAGVNTLLYIGISSRLSATYSAAQAAAQLINEKFPDRNVVLFDSKMATIAQGMIVIEAAHQAKQGASLDQINSRIEDVRQRVGLVATLETLKYLERGGRIGKATFFLGSLIQVLPLLTIDGNGLVVPLTRVRGKREAMKKMVSYVAKQVAGCTYLRLAIMEADAITQAEELRDLAMQILKPDEIFWTDVTPVMVAHAGPGMYGLAYYYE